jgi:LytS/YehU family sensor histidine kinase
MAAQLQARTSQLEANLANAQLDALKMQLHPHFLFNTLNTISVMMQQDVPAANKMLVRLSSLLRTALANSGEHEIPVRDELEFLRNYLEIEQTRFGNRLSVKIEADPGSLDALVPNMVLQPLAENAIRHGVGSRSLKGLVEVKIARLNGAVILSVYDNGPGPGAGEEPGNGIGLANTKARLAQLYGTDSSFELSQLPSGGTVATVSIPYHV